MISKYKKSLQLSLAVALGAGALAFLIPNQASAQVGSQVLICFRGVQIIVPGYLVPRYVGAGAFAGPCQPTPP